jgi:tRNA U34 2-thiouridine synthase MnmA/TrmU
MASASPERPCVTCNKGNNGIFKCEGCTQEFCTTHATGHRKILYHQLEEILAEHDTLQDIITANKDQVYSLTSYIDEWERTSMKKIQQMAKETRQKVAELADIHRGEFVFQ